MSDDYFELKYTDYHLIIFRARHHPNLTSFPLNSDEKTNAHIYHGQNAYRYVPYRGPKLLGLGYDGNLLGRYLAMLTVPGLLEGRPSLVCGDIVYVRSVRLISQHFICPTPCRGEAFMT